jgi:hypothetical protein
LLHALKQASKQHTGCFHYLLFVLGGFYTDSDFKVVLFGTSARNFDVELEQGEQRSRYGQQRLSSLTSEAETSPNLDLVHKFSEIVPRVQIAGA